MEKEPTYQFETFQMDKHGSSLVAISLRLRGKEEMTGERFITLEESADFEGFIMSCINGPEVTFTPFTNNRVVGYALRNKKTKEERVGILQEYNTDSVQKYLNDNFYIVSPSSSTRQYTTWDEPKEEEEKELSTTLDYSNLQNHHITIYSQGQAVIQTPIPFSTFLSQKEHSTTTAAAIVVLGLAGLPEQIDSSSFMVSGATLDGYRTQKISDRAFSSTSLGIQSDLIGRKAIVTWIDDSHSGDKKIVHHEDEGEVLSLIFPPTAMSEKYGIVLEIEEIEEKEEKKKKHSKSHSFPSKSIKAILGKIVSIQVLGDDSDIYYPSSMSRKMGTLLELHLRLDNNNNEEEEEITTQKNNDSIILSYIAVGMKWESLYVLEIRKSNLNGNKVKGNFTLRAAIDNTTGCNFEHVDRITFIEGPLHAQTGIYNALANIPYEDIGSATTTNREIENEPMTFVSRTNPEEEENTSNSTSRIQFSVDTHMTIAREYPMESSTQYVNVKQAKNVSLHKYIVFGYRVEGAPIVSSSSRKKGGFGVAYQFKNNKKMNDLGWVIPKGKINVRNEEGILTSTLLPYAVYENEIANIYTGESTSIQAHLYPVDKSKLVQEGGGFIKRKTHKIHVQTQPNTNNNEKLTFLIKLKARDKLSFAGYDATSHLEKEELPIKYWVKETKNRPNPFTGKTYEPGDQSLQYFQVPASLTDFFVTFVIEYVENE